jgi:LacI family repressor for deo operon, udp, cdd, tsx, nupC, and nupG
MGRTVADLYFKEMENKDTLVVPKTISIKPKLIIRSSTSRKK